MTGALATIARFTYRHDGEYARGFLEEAGIASQLIVDDAAGHLSFANVATLVVRAEDAEAAIEALRSAHINLG